MAGLGVFITSDASDFEKVLDELQMRTSPIGLMSFLEAFVDPWIRNRIEARFDGEGDDVVGSWDPLSVATSQIRSFYGFPPDHPINVRTGKMRSFLVGTDSDVKDSGVGATLTHPPIGAADPITAKKIQTAQAGSASPSTPSRPVLGVADTDLVFVTSALAAWLVEDMI